jgi:hypothetical protein
LSGVIIDLIHVDVIWPPPDLRAELNPYTLAIDSDDDIDYEEEVSPSSYDGERTVQENSSLRVRRTSEGYEVRTLSVADRERMVEKAMMRWDSDSVDDEDDEDNVVLADLRPT